MVAADTPLPVAGGRDGSEQIWAVPMGQLNSTSLPEYECRLLDRGLRVVRAFLLVCRTDLEAQQAANEIFLRHDGEGLAGFEIWKDGCCFAVQLRERPGDVGDWASPPPLHGDLEASP